MEGQGRREGAGKGGGGAGEGGEWWYSLGVPLGNSYHIKARRCLAAFCILYNRTEARDEP